jgi:methylglutaconyl-CoA hydratase
MSLRIDRDGRLLRLTLDRPEKKNAFDETVIAALTDAYVKAGADDGVGAVLLQAEGSHFSSGGDLAWMSRMAGYSAEENLEDAKRLAAMLKAIDRCPKPTLARVQGPAYAGAVGILACCDFVVAAQAASFAVTEVRIGLIPAVIGPYLVRAMGVREARRWCLSAESFPAATAQRLGLVHEVAAAAELDACILSQLDLLFRASAPALAAAKALLAEIDRPLDDAVIAMTAERIAERRASLDAREGLAAFLEKRAPSWRTAK